MISDLEDPRTLKEIELENCTPYELESYEKQSLVEIERMNDSDLYVNSEKVQEHLAFIEHLKFKFEGIRVSESGEGYSTENVDEALLKIALLIRKLMQKLYSLDGDLKLATTLPTYRFKYA